MRKIIWFLQFSALVIGVQAGFVAISLAASAKAQLSPTAIADIKSIAGKWEGIMIRTPKSKTDDWVRVSIQDTGDYDFASYRTIGVFSGKGTLTVADGKATAESERGKLTLQLLTDKASGQLMLRAEGRRKDGVSYRAELKKTGDTAPSGQK
jgi:hypothetical protein